ncbi:MAG TPA: hypothetical protein DEV81_02585 [Cyanobacteria bacterium UBA11049]|nr:hypothetical protein [Cyanobacteria bacterium UBA11049]
MAQAKIKRHRGVIITASGVKRLQEAIRAEEIAHNKGEHFSLESLSARINISTKTLSRIWSVGANVDQKTLKLCFSAFDLELGKEDYLVTTEIETEESNEFSLANISENKEYKLQTNPKDSPSQQIPTLSRTTWPYPNGPVPLDSPFYLERPPVEELVYQELTQPGCVIRIRAPREMGKSSLVLRLLTFARQQQYHQVKLDCPQIETSSLSDLNLFFRRFCTHVARELNLAPNLEENWDEEIGSKLSCSFYFKNYLLKSLKNPLVLVLEQIDYLFKYPQLIGEFFPLLRSWYEEARRDPVWQRLKLILVYSTEEYVALDINRSPFNIGLPLRLEEFTPQQVKELARRHGLNWSLEHEVSQLMSLVGGHPSLIRMSLYYLCTQTMSLQSLIGEALANGGIYRYHLWRHWVSLQENPTLAENYQKVVTASSCISIPPVETYRLESLGLIAYEGARLKPRCELYRTYFKKQLFTTL